ncbi:MAG: type II toxin-antitoxin system VapC family toxin [Pseudomonadota bacterium]|nr:type II toxin-antitoxin system VapC family toxin [Pseudomonadota bacterium]
MVLVADASVVAKLFLDEEDKPMAVDLFRHATVEGEPLLVPDIVVSECMSVGLRKSVPLGEVHDMLTVAFGAFLKLVVPDRGIWVLAGEMAKGHPDHGRPGLQNCLYHAIAIELEGTLVTADRGHLNKTARWAHAIALDEWRP